MTSEPTNNTSAAGPDGTPPSPRRCPKISRRLMGAGVIVAVLAVGAIGGVSANRYIHRSWPQAVLLLQPAPIAQMTERTPVAIKGQVAEVFGNKFIVQDDSGRTLVDTGPRGENAKPVAKGETLTVQGRFDNGFIHAQVMTRADGTSEAFGSPRYGHPARGPGGWHGPRGDRGPGFDRGPGADRGPGGEFPSPRR